VIICNYLSLFAAIIFGNLLQVFGIIWWIKMRVVKNLTSTTFGGCGVPSLQLPEGIIVRLWVCIGLFESLARRADAIAENIFFQH
jgi:hypothetical protein